MSSTSSTPPSIHDPAGTARMDWESISFLFTDIEGSTRLWERQPELMQAALAHHDLLVRSEIERSGGRVFKTIGDAFCAAFQSPRAAVLAALAAQRALYAELPDVRVRMAVHTGPAEERGGDYFGPALNRVARLLAAGHGGQVLLSQAAADACRHELPQDAELRFLGSHELRDIVEWETIYQLQPADLPADFPPLKTSDLERRRGYRRGLSWGLAVATVVGVLATVATRQWRRAERAVRAEQHHRMQAQHNLFVARINLIGQAFDLGDVTRARQLLREARQADPGAAGRLEWQLSHWLVGEREQGKDARILTGHTGTIAGLAISPDGREIASAATDRTARIWAAATGKTRAVLNSDQKLLGVAYARDARWIAIAGDLGRIELWDTAAVRRVRTLQAHGSTIWWLAVSRDGRALASCSEDTTARLWDTHTWEALAVLRGHQGKLRSVDFSPDGSKAATGGDDRTARLWDVRSGKLLATLAGHSATVWMTRFSPDGSLLATGAQNGELKLWDVRTGLELSGPKAHRTHINGLAFSPDGRLLATAGGDGRVKLWDLATREELLTLPEPNRYPVTCVEFSPDGRTLAAATERGSRVELWHAREPTD